MISIGLTGSIAMGKTTCARQFKNFDIPVFDADAYVHELLEKPETKSLISKTFPELSVENVTRDNLRQLVFGNKEKITKLEKILHPLVREAEESFYFEKKRMGCKFCVFDIPLLFETGVPDFIDITIVVWAPKFLQIQRLQARKQYTQEQIDFILSQQMDIKEKMRRADIIIPSSLGIEEFTKKIKKLMKDYYG